MNFSRRQDCFGSACSVSIFSKTGSPALVNSPSAGPVSASSVPSARAKVGFLERIIRLGRCFGSAVTDIIVSREGVAVWYTILASKDGEMKHDKKCMDILAGKKKLDCLPYKGKHLRWTDEGLFWEMETKSGDKHTLAYSAGEHLPPKAVRQILVNKVAIMDAVWTGHSIGIAAITNNTIRYSVVESDGVVGGT